MIVKHRATGLYLQSPHTWDDGDALWMWVKPRKDAHQFKSRAEAKATLRSISPDYKVKEFTFEKP